MEIACSSDPVENFRDGCGGLTIKCCYGDQPRNSKQQSERAGVRDGSSKSQDAADENRQGAWFTTAFPGRGMHWSKPDLTALSAAARGSDVPTCLAAQPDLFRRGLQDQSASGDHSGLHTLSSSQVHHSSSKE